jgi:hypothetical protein
VRLIVKRRRWPVLLILILAACWLAACAQTPLPDVTQPQTAQPQTAVVESAQKTAGALATTAPTLTAGWQVFNDPEAGYTLSYPPDVHISTGKSKAGVYTTRIQFHVPGVEGYQGMLVRVEPNPAGAGVEQTVAALYERLMGQAATGETIKALKGLAVDGLAGVRMGEGGDFAVVVPYGDRVYVIAPVHDMATTSLDPQALALFSQVLSTLRIQR